MHLLYFYVTALPTACIPPMEDCPLCAHEDQELRYPDDPWITDEIQARFPDWRPEQGLCGTCLKEFENPFRP
ncbi:MAG: hypothetical protein V3U86_03955 [Acidobacteriota bacterium]